MHFATVNYSENKICPPPQLLMKIYDAGRKTGEFPVYLTHIWIEFELQLIVKPLLIRLLDVLFNPFNTVQGLIWLIFTLEYPVLKGKRINSFTFVELIHIFMHANEQNLCVNPSLICLLDVLFNLYILFRVWFYIWEL